MFYSIDRISGDIAYLMADDQTILEVLLENIVGNAKEGDIVKKQGNQFLIDEEKTQSKRRDIQNLLNELLCSNTDKE